MADDDVFCLACDCVLDVQQVLDEAEGSAEVDILAVDDSDGGEEVLFDPDELADEGAADGDDAASLPLDADRAAELAQALEGGTGTVELGDGLGEGEGAMFDADAPLDSSELFDDPLASAEGDPVPPPVLSDSPRSSRASRCMPACTYTQTIAAGSSSCAATERGGPSRSRASPSCPTGAWRTT